MNNKPSILVEGVYPKANNWVSVLFTKVIKADEQPESKSLLSLSNRGIGDAKVFGNEDKKLTAFLNFTQASLEQFGIKEGIDINTLGLPSVYDIIEKYSSKLSKDYFDADGNITIEPIVNKNTQEIQLYSGKPMYRTTHLVEGASIDTLPKSDVKPTKTGYIESVFDEERFVESEDGKKKKTPAFQAYLNSVYSYYNVPSSAIQFQPESGKSLLEAAEAVKEEAFA